MYIVENNMYILSFSGVIVPKNRVVQGSGCKPYYRFIIFLRLSMYVYYFFMFLN